MDEGIRLMRQEARGRKGIDWIPSAFIFIVLEIIRAMARRKKYEETETRRQNRKK